jgi:hypothetical protein
VLDLINKLKILITSRSEKGGADKSGNAFDLTNDEIYTDHD